MEKLLYLILLWVISAISAHSQEVVEIIVDETNQPIEFANIAANDELRRL